MSWSESALVKRIEEERLAAEEAKAKLHFDEHVKIVKLWRSKGMRVKLPRRGDGDVKPPKEGTQMWRILLEFGENGMSTKTVAKNVGAGHQVVISAVSKLRERGMLMLRSSRSNRSYSYGWTAAATRYAESMKIKRRLA
jgi:hypothetical protein